MILVMYKSFLQVEKIVSVSVSMVDVCECVRPNLNPGWHQAALWQPSHQTVPPVHCVKLYQCVSNCTSVCQAVPKFVPNCTKVHLSPSSIYEGRMIAAHHVQHLASLSPELALPPGHLMPYQAIPGHPML